MTDRVLVVEDNPSHRQALQDQLTLRGFEVAAAPDLTEALAAAQRWSPTVVLVDVRLPDGDGLDLVRALRSGSPAQLPFVVATTANAYPEDRERALQAGCDNFVAKPFRIDELVDLIVQRRQSRPLSAPPPGRAVLAHELKGMAHSLVKLAGDPGLDEADRSALRSVAARIEEVSGATSSRLAAAEPVPPGEPTATLRQAVPAVLLVEDDVGQARKLADLLASVGYRVEVAASLAEAEEAITNAQHAAYVVDILLDDESGIDFVQRHRTLLRPGENVVFMSIAPAGFGPRLAAIGARRVYDKRSDALDVLLRLIREITGPTPSPLSAEDRIAEAGDALVRRIRSLTEGSLPATEEIDRKIAGDVAAFVRLAHAAQSSDVNRFAVACRYVEAVSRLCASPFLMRARSAAVTAYYELLSAWLRGRRAYLRWALVRLWGLTTGYGEAMGRLLAVISLSALTCAALITAWPETFEQAFGTQRLSELPGMERVAVALYVSFANSLLVGTEDIAAVAAGSRLLHLGQTVLSLALLSVLISMVTLRIRRTNGF
jgi:two-component system, OmpR family, response regulator